MSNEQVLYVNKIEERDSLKVATVLETNLVLQNAAIMGGESALLALHSLLSSLTDFYSITSHLQIVVFTRYNAEIGLSQTYYQSSDVDSILAEYDRLIDLGWPVYNRTEVALAAQRSLDHVPIAVASFHLVL